MAAVHAVYRDNKTSINRALQFVVTGGVGRTALLSLPGTATAILSQNWRISMRLRIDATAVGGYFFARSQGPTDEFSFFYNNSYIRFFANGHNLPDINFPLTIATPPSTAFLSVVYSYDGTTLRAFLNGRPAGTLLANGLVLHAGDGNVLALGLRNETGGGPSNVTIDYFELLDEGQIKIQLKLDEAAPGPYTNTGTAGGQLTLGNPAPDSILI